MFGRYIKTTRLHLLSRIRLKYVVCGVIAAFVIYEFGLLTHLFERDYESYFSYPLEVDMGDILMSLKTGKGPAVAPINNFTYRFKLKNEHKCRQSSEDTFDKVVILYMVKSALSNRPQRDGIRKSWGWEGRFSDVVIRRVFLLGSADDPQIQDQIDEEYAQHKDLIQADFLDTYYNNTIKTIMGFKWVLSYCSNVQFVMFADDDMYISTKNLLKFLRNPFNEDMEYRKLLQFDFLWPKKKTTLPLSAYDGRLLSGYVFFSSPMRHRTSKWYISLDEYPFSKYPPYVTAGAYVMSYPALEDIYHTSTYTKVFKFDDVYLGIVAKKCGITPLHNENFYFWKKPYDKYEYKSVIASHGYGDPHELMKVWEEQRTLGHA